jgi:hypothetical protein
MMEQIDSDRRIMSSNLFYALSDDVLMVILQEWIVYDEKSDCKYQASIWKTLVGLDSALTNNEDRDKYHSLLSRIFISWSSMMFSKIQSPLHGINWFIKRRISINKLIIDSKDLCILYENSHIVSHQSFRNTTYVNVCKRKRYLVEFPDHATNLFPKLKAVQFTRQFYKDNVFNTNDFKFILLLPKNALITLEFCFRDVIAGSFELLEEIFRNQHSSLQKLSILAYPLSIIHLLLLYPCSALKSICLQLFNTYAEHEVLDYWRVQSIPDMLYLFFQSHPQLEDISLYTCFRSPWNISMLTPEVLWRVLDDGFLKEVRKLYFSTNNIITPSSFTRIIQNCPQLNSLIMSSIVRDAFVYSVIDGNNGKYCELELHSWIEYDEVTENVLPNLPYPLISIVLQGLYVTGHFQEPSEQCYRRLVDLHAHTIRKVVLDRLYMSTMLHILSKLIDPEEIAIEYNPCLWREDDDDEDEELEEVTEVVENEELGDNIVEEQAHQPEEEEEEDHDRYVDNDNDDENNNNNNNNDSDSDSDSDSEDGLDPVYVDLFRLIKQKSQRLTKLTLLIERSTISVEDICTLVEDCPMLIELTLKENCFRQNDLKRIRRRFPKLTKVGTKEIVNEYFG